MNAGDVLEPRTFTVTRADLVAYADASGDHNPIHQDEDVARSVGLPGVIAHGMYTLALVGRAVAEWTGGAEVVDLGAKFTSPVVVPAEGGAEVGRRRHREVGRRRPGHARARGDVRGHRRCSACPRPSCARPPSVPDLRDHTTLRLGGPGREWVRATTEAELVAAVADADAAGTPVLLLGGRLQPRRRRRGLRRPGRGGRDHRRRRRHRHLRRRRPRPVRRSRAHGGGR